MVIVLTGGGSGGHITPILAVAAELKRLQPDAQLIYIGQTGDKFGSVPAAHSAIDATYSVRAGKFRRYHGLGWRRLLKLGTLLLNCRDFIFVGIGYLQSLILLRRLKPDVLFIKGGFVGVPVGLAAANLRIPYVTHDSDAIPGLANRIIARWSKVHAVGQPKELYPYPAARTVTVGVPVQPEYLPVDAALQADYRTQLGLSLEAPIICVAGGGLGAQRINEALLTIAPQLFTAWPNLIIIHQVGRLHEAAMVRAYDELLPTVSRSHVVIKGYVTDMYRLSGAADVIVSRAGATNMAEFAVQAKACIIVPNPYLTGGHQIKNAQALADQQAIITVTEVAMVQNAQVLYDAIDDLLLQPTQRAALAGHLQRMAHPDAATRLAMVLLKQTNQRNKHAEPKKIATPN